MQIYPIEAGGLVHHGEYLAEAEPALVRGRGVHHPHLGGQDGEYEDFGEVSLGAGVSMKAVVGRVERSSRAESTDIPPEDGR